MSTAHSPERAVDRPFTRCHTLRKDSVGVIHVHSRMWRPGRVTEVVYEAPGGGRWIVPEDRWEQVMSATSDLEVMALLRSPAP